MQKNEVFHTIIAAMTAEGAGLCRVDGMAVFVPGTAVGDECEIRIVKVLRNYAFGRLERLLSPAPCRAAPRCPVSTQCGGCVFQHLSYEEELRVKTQRVRDALDRIAGTPDLPLEPILAASSPERYRNKCQFPIGLDRDGRLTLGFYAVHSHRIVNAASCLLQPEVFDCAAEAFRAWFAESGESVYDERTHTGALRHLFLRIGEPAGEVAVCVVANAEKLRAEARLVARLREAVPGLTGVALNTNTANTNVILGQKDRVLWGKASVRAALCGLEFEIGPHAFFQVNRAQAERLYQKAAEYAGLTGGETLLDLYCGAGTIGLSMADRVKKVIGVEVVPEAVGNARENARRNGIENAEFLCADAAEAASTLLARGERPDVVILDPPRKGCAEALVGTVAEMQPSRVVYVSCDPATLARDLARFAALGYRAEKAAPVDMFPRTAHVETVVRLSQEVNP